MKEHISVKYKQNRMQTAALSIYNNHKLIYRFSEGVAIIWNTFPSLPTKITLSLTCVESLVLPFLIIKKNKSYKPQVVAFLPLVRTAACPVNYKKN